MNNTSSISLITKLISNSKISSHSLELTLDCTLGPESEENALDSLLPDQNTKTELFSARDCNEYPEINHIEYKEFTNSSDSTEKPYPSS